MTSNLILSQKRAETVMNFLISQGVKPAMLWPAASAKPIQLHPTTPPRAARSNRGVELTLSAPAS